MVSMFALLSNLLLASMALAIPPSQPKALLARQSQPGQVVVSIPSLGYSSNIEEMYSQSQGGFAWLGNLAGVFKIINVTIVVPTFEGKDGASFETKLCIDGFSCNDARLEIGISCGQHYNVYSGWLPDIPRKNFDISISPGDKLRLTLDTRLMMGSGMARVEKLETGESAERNFTSNYPLCHANAAFLALPKGDPISTDFAVHFTDIVITGPNDTVYALSPGGTVINMASYSFSNATKILSYTAVEDNNGSITIQSLPEPVWANN